MNLYQSIHFLHLLFMKKTFVMLGLAALTFACQNNASTTDESTQDTTTIIIDEGALADDATKAAETMAKTYDVRGQLVEIKATNENGLTIASVDHEEIEGFMMAMRMDFEAEPALLEGYQAGDKISFKIEQTETGYKITSIEKLPADTELKLKEM